MAKAGKAGALKAKNKASHKAHVAKTSGKSGSAFKRGNASTNPNRPAGKGQTHLRSKATINRLNMYKSRPNQEKMKAAPKVPMVRIEPDRRWFGNTRVLAQSKLQQFREEMSKSVEDPFNVVLKASKLPMSLLKDADKQSRMKLLQVESFAQTFGSKALRKKPKLSVESLEALAQAADKGEEEYEETKDKQKVSYDEAKATEEVEKTLVSEHVFLKGTSKRIWGELYKVIDSSDVVLEVIDARDPLGTRNKQFECELRKKHPHKKLVLLLNKVDLIPSWAAKRWTAVLNKEYPTVAFHASVTNPFGKSALIQLLRQFAQLLSNRQHVQIGLVGYPSVGKSSVINALKMKKVCKSSPIPGETKVWQYISLTKRIFLIDCPGIVPPSSSDFSADSAKVLKGVVRVEKVEYPSNYIPEVLERVKRKYILSKYGFPKDHDAWADHEEFLTQLAHKKGKLRKGGEPDIEIVARSVLYDWQRGRIPFFVAPPVPEGDEEEEAAPAADGDAPAPVQAFKELKCAQDFDEEDARGGVADDEPAAAKAAKPAKAAEAEDAEDAEAPKKGKKRKAEEKKDGAKKKKPKKAKEVAPSAALDWNAVAAEFAA